MVLTSIKMLRNYNKTIKIRVFVIGNGEPKLFADSLNVEVIYRQPSQDSKGYFCLNREYLAECKEQSVLHIDGDTFIFDDIEKIFDKYNDVDFAAAQDDWIVNTPDWNYSFLEVGSTVFNGGLTLWNNGTIREWASNFLVPTCNRLQNEKCALTPWLFGSNRRCYHKETFAICYYVAQKGLKYRLMDEKDVVNLFNPESYKAWNRKDFIVYHCFTQNWKQFANSLRKKKIAMLKIRDK